jgi:hypothetical protein
MFSMLGLLAVVQEPLCENNFFGMALNWVLVPWIFLSIILTVLILILPDHYSLFNSKKSETQSTKMERAGLGGKSSEKMVFKKIPMYSSSRKLKVKAKRKKRKKQVKPKIKFNNFQDSFGWVPVDRTKAKPSSTKRYLKQVTETELLDKAY